MPFAGLQTEDSAVSFKGSVGIVGQNTSRKDFAQLNAFLIETVDIPDKALEHYFVFIVSQKSTQNGRGDRFANNNAGGTFAVETLVGVLVCLADSKGYDLGCNIGIQLLLAGAVFDHNVLSSLTVLKSDELQWNDIGSLMKQLIEGMLSVGTGLTEDDRTGRIGNLLAEAAPSLIEYK